MQKEQLKATIKSTEKHISFDINTTKASTPKKPTTVFYAGCFDPFTNGHLDVIKQALERFDKVILGLGISEKKTRQFDRKEMINAIQKTLNQEKIQDKVLCTSYDHYTGEKALELSCSCLIRGIKNLEEFEYEKYLFRYNRDNYNLNTLFFLPSRPDLEIVSSTYAKQLYSSNDKKTLKSILPKAIFDYVWQIKTNSKN